MSPRLSPLDSTWRKRRPGNSSFPSNVINNRKFKRAGSSYIIVLPRKKTHVITFFYRRCWRKKSAEEKKISNVVFSHRRRLSKITTKKTKEIKNPLNVRKIIHPVTDQLSKKHHHDQVEKEFKWRRYTEPRNSSIDCSIDWLIDWLCISWLIDWLCTSWLIDCSYIGWLIDWLRELLLDVLTFSD